MIVVEKRKIDVQVLEQAIIEDIRSVGFVTTIKGKAVSYIRFEENSQHRMLLRKRLAFRLKNDWITENKVI